MMHFRREFSLSFFIFCALCFHAREARGAPEELLIVPHSPFSVALDTLQQQLKYTFQNINLLRRAMTHASFSEENNHALSILGTTIIETSVSLRYLQKDIDVSAKDLNRKISEILNVQNSCAMDGTRLGLDKIVRVSPKTNSTTPSVVCGAFRAVFGAVAIDTGKSDDAGNVFWRVHSGNDDGAKIRSGGRVSI